MAIQHTNQFFLTWKCQSDQVLEGLSICLKGRVIQSQGETDLPSTASLLKWQTQSGLVQVIAKDPRNPSVFPILISGTKFSHPCFRGAKLKA